MMLEDIIKQLLKSGISVELTYDKVTDLIGYVIDGFYKSDTVTVYDIGGVLEVTARYGEVTVITSLQDLVDINISWWEYSKDSFSGWNLMDSKWVALSLNLKETR